MTVAQAPVDGQPVDPETLTDGFHLLIDALKLNGINTIYNVPGIPITDLGRYAQAQGMRVISFRHEQHAGYAASVAGFLTKMPGVCMTVSAPGFMNGLTAVANATTNCWPMILISGSSEREIVDLAAGRLRGNGPAGHRAALHAKAAYRLILHAEDIGIAVARAIRSAVSRSSGRGISGHSRRDAGAGHGRCRRPAVSGRRSSNPAPRSRPSPPRRSSARSA